MAGPLSPRVRQSPVPPGGAGPFTFAPLQAFPMGLSSRFLQRLGQVLQSGGQIVQFYLIFIKLEHFVPTLSN